MAYKRTYKKRPAKRMYRKITKLPRNRPGPIYKRPNYKKSGATYLNFSYQTAASNYQMATGPLCFSTHIPYVGRNLVNNQTLVADIAANDTHLIF